MGRGDIVPLARPFIGEAERRAVDRVLGSRHLAQGPEVEALEREVSAMLGGRSVTAVSSGGAALFLSLAVLGVGRDDEVVVPAFTFPAAAQAAAMLGAVPVPADVSFDTMSMNPDTLRPVLGRRVKAVVASHAFGIPADMEELALTARSEGLPLIEDAACALGGLSGGGARAGTVGTTACFSLHPRKLATGGEGGLVASDPDNAARLRAARDYGRTGRGYGDVFGSVGMNFRMSDLGAAVARVQVGRLQDSTVKRGDLVGAYRDALGRIDGVVLPAGYERPGQTWQTLVLVLDRPAAPVVDALGSFGVEAGPAAYDLTQQAFYRRRWSPGVPCPVAAELASRTLALPLYDEMDGHDVEHVVSALAMAMNGR